MKVSGGSGGQVGYSTPLSHNARSATVVPMFIGVDSDFALLSGLLTQLSNLDSSQPPIWLPYTFCVSITYYQIGCKWKDGENEDRKSEEVGVGQRSGSRITDLSSCKGCDFCELLHENCFNRSCSCVFTWFHVPPPAKSQYSVICFSN